MKKIFYVVIPIIAFALILSNALFGHLLFGSPYDQDINKYAIYVHLLSGWNSYPGNILFEVTNVWSNPNPESDEQSFSISPSDLSSLVSYNPNQLQYQREKSYVELKHEFSGCETNWKPTSYRYLVDSLRNKIEIAQGLELSDDPYTSQFPNSHSAKHKADLKNGYVQFIPICTSSDMTSYDFAVSLNDKNIAFDVFFVPSEDEISSYLNSGSFESYPGDECSGENFHSFTGTCSNVGRDSGLMILLPDNFEQSLTKIKVSIRERL